ncbi:MAG: HlyD family efflux transporter periplasmic adaptor subunit [Gammaproteobacteria bacterium]|nr:HlyD family efflux transporter periplasmic adaptor subunit [Gammaproteobacteria bacterium]
MSEIDNSVASLIDEEIEQRRIHRRNLAIVVMTAIFLLILIVWYLYWFFISRFALYTDDAYVNGNMVQLMSQIPGTVTDINVDDTQFVKQGQVLIKFDPTDTQVALQHAEAALAETVREVRQLFENVKRAKAALDLRKAGWIKAQFDLKRRQGLIKENAISREEYQHYQIAEETAEAEYNASLYHFLAAQALVANTSIYTHPLVERAKANLKTAYLDVKRSVVLAPVSGYVAKRSVQVGQRILVNTPMLAIVPLKDTWVDANYKESQLNNLRIGQPVTLYADAYPDVTYHGKIFGLNAGTGAAFALLPPQNATGNWIKIVQRLPVRVWLDPNELKKHPLQLGLSMHVTTDIHHLNGYRLASSEQVKPIYTTFVYAQQLAQADQLINTILRNSSPDMSVGEV